MTTGVGLDSVGTEEFDFRKASFIDRPIEERSERERKFILNAEKWPRTWDKINSPKYVTVTDKMNSEAWRKKITKVFRDIEVSEGEINALAYSGALGELVVLSRLGDILNYAGKRHYDLKSAFGNITVEVKSMAAERLYDPSGMLFLVVKRPVEQIFNYIIFVCTPKKDLAGHQAIICGYQSYDQYKDEQVNVLEGTPNGIIEQLKYDNWGIDFRTMQPIDNFKNELKEML